MKKNHNQAQAAEPPQETVDTRPIPIHPLEDFDGMRRAGRLAAACLDHLTPLVTPGVILADLDAAAHSFILDHGATPACLYYRGYRATICTSVNHVICHGFPVPKPLRDGDIVNIDVTVILDGWHGDTSRMYVAGEAKRKAARLIDVTYEAMWKGIDAVRPGATFGDIGHAIQRHAEAARYSVVHEFCGHGIGRKFHDAPNVMHIGSPGEGPELKPGMIFTIEPMINAGKAESKLLSDGWTAVTKDKELSAQFEHTVGVTEDGVEVFTRSPAGLDRPVFAA